ncbi:MAG: hypothetical protein ACI87W_001374 [Halieaceae bacterium]|jgi:hypothetical protein
MPDTVVLIAIAASLLFFGALLWKVLWFIRKINSSEEEPRDP